MWGKILYICKGGAIFFVGLVMWGMIILWIICLWITVIAIIKPERRS